jgi:hypothetical protein
LGEGGEPFVVSLESSAEPGWHCSLDVDGFGVAGVVICKISVSEPCLLWPDWECFPEDHERTTIY